MFVVARMTKEVRIELVNELMKKQTQAYISLLHWEEKC